MTFAKYVSEFKWIIPCSLGVAVIIDAVTTGTLTYYLHKCRTGFRRWSFSYGHTTKVDGAARTDSLIDILIVYTINTGTKLSFGTSPTVTDKDMQGWSQGTSP